MIQYHYQDLLDNFIVKLTSESARSEQTAHIRRHKVLLCCTIESEPSQLTTRAWQKLLIVMPLLLLHVGLVQFVNNTNVILEQCRECNKKWVA
jgi:hypothetical protein